MAVPAVVGAGLVQRRLRSQAEWEKAWFEKPTLSSLVRQLVDDGSPEPREAFAGAIGFLAGALERHGFVLFRNGGMPLIERHSGELRQELLVRFGPHPVRGAVVPLTLQLHVSHTGLRTIRERYWPVLGHIPTSIAGGNIGLLQPIPTYDIWNVAGDRSLSDLREHIEAHLLPYLETLADGPSLRHALYETGLPLVDQATAIELLLHEYGRREARVYLEETILQRPDLRDRFREIDGELATGGALQYRPGDTLRNVAVIARTHRVLAPR